MNLKNNLEVQNFLSTLENKITFPEARAEIRTEFSRHIEDITREKIESGLSTTDAISNAIKQLGDPVAIGEQLDQIHSPKFPRLLLAISLGLLGLGVFNAMEFHKLGNHSVNIILGAIIAIFLCYLRPNKLSKSAGILYSGAFAFLVFGSVFGEYEQGSPYLRFLCFYIDVVGFSLFPLVIGILGLIGNNQNFSKRKPFLLTLLTMLPLITFALLGSPYGLLLFGVAALTMFVSATMNTKAILAIAIVFAAGINFTFSSEKFHSPISFSQAIQNEAHTDFVLNSFYDKSSFLSLIGIFLCLTLVAQLASAYLESRSQFARTALATHLGILGVSIIWSLLASLGFVPMPSAGAPLPFVSYGGSLLVGHLALLGLTVGFCRRRTLTLLIQ